MERKPLIQYIRNRKNQKIGVLYADVHFSGADEKKYIGLGWSLCNKKDKFKKEFGLGIAIRRSFDFVFHPEKFFYFSQNLNMRLAEIKVPKSIESQWYHFMKRAEKYYKDATFNKE